MPEDNRDVYDLKGLIDLAVDELEKVIGPRIINVIQASGAEFDDEQWEKIIEKIMERPLGVEVKIQLIQWICRAYEAGRSAPRKPRER